MREPTSNPVQVQPTRSLWPIVAIIAALALAAAALFIWTPQTTPTADPSALSVADECKAALGYPARSSADRAWLRTCVHALTPPTATPAPTPSTGPSPTSSPTDAPTPSPTTTVPIPSSSPSPPPTGSSGPCLPVPVACGYPDATNTGARGPLEAVQGDVLLSTAGEVYADKDVAGCISVTAPNVVIHNVRVACGANPDGGSTWAIEYNGQGGGTLTVEDTTVVCTFTGDTGIGNNNYIARRVDVSGCDNGWAIYDGNVTIVDSYCHDLTDENLHPEAHTDCVEGNMLFATLIQHNTLNAGHNATSAVGGACGLCGTTVRTGWRILGNLLDGGDGGAIYCLRTIYESGSVIAGNRIGTNQHYGPAPSDSCDNPRVTWTGNVYDATGLPVAAA